MVWSPHLSDFQAWAPPLCYTAIPWKIVRPGPLALGASSDLIPKLLGRKCGTLPSSSQSPLFFLKRCLMEDLSYKMICREMGSKQTKDGEMLQMKIPFWRFILYGRILKAQDSLAWRTQSSSVFPSWFEYRILPACIKSINNYGKLYSTGQILENGD